MHVQKNTNASSAVLSVDAEKAFDRLEWPFLWRVLQQIGLGSDFIGMIKTMYFNPSASVTTGQIISASFQISRSTRQGDPLSSLLFILSLEPLAQAIRQATNIHPISINSTKHNLSLFADDVLLFLSDINQSLPNVFNIFDQFYVQL